MLVHSTNASIQKMGWMDAAVSYQRTKFLEDLDSLPPVDFHARIEKPPPNYIDSDDWTIESVIRLLQMLRSSKNTRRVFQEVRSKLQEVDTRRFLIRTDFDSMPSLGVKAINEIYYSSLEESYDEYKKNTVKPKKTGRQQYLDEDVIVISNPVEARLPSSQISIRLLKEILENRAKAAKQMPTKHSTIPWITTTASVVQARKWLGSPHRRGPFEEDLSAIDKKVLLLLLLGYPKLTIGSGKDDDKDKDKPTTKDKDKPTTKGEEEKTTKEEEKTTKKEEEEEETTTVGKEEETEAEETTTEGATEAGTPEEETTTEEAETTTEEGTTYHDEPTNSTAGGGVNTTGGGAQNTTPK